MLRLLSERYQVPIRTLRRTLTVRDLEEEFAQYIVHEGLDLAKAFYKIGERPTGDSLYDRVAQHYFDQWTAAEVARDNAQADAQLGELGF